MPRLAAEAGLTPNDSSELAAAAASDCSPSNTSLWKELALYQKTVRLVHCGLPIRQAPSPDQQNFRRFDRAAGSALSDATTRVRFTH